MKTIDSRIADRVVPLTPLDTGLEPSGILPEKPDAFLFDVYGTLLISASGDISVGNDAKTPFRSLAVLLNQYSVPGQPEDLCRSLRKEIVATHERMKKQGVDYPEVEIDRVWQAVLGTDDRDLARQFALEFEMAVNPVYPMPDAASILIALRKKNIPAGIISNAQFYTGHLFKLFFGDLPQDSWADPELIFYSFEHGHAKPSAYLFKQAADVLGKKKIAISKTLYVGNDMIKDIAPAAALGFKTALFAGDARSLRLGKKNPGGSGPKPDLVITALDQLAPYI